MILDDSEIFENLISTQAHIYLLINTTEIKVQF